MDEKGSVIGHFIIRYPKDDDDTSVRFVKLFRGNLSFAIPAEEDAVINIFIAFRNPHGEFPGCYGGLSVQHSGMEGQVPVLAENKLHARIDAVLRLIISESRYSMVFFSILSR